MTDIVLNPVPAFVIKTLLVQSTKSPARKQGTKVFINVCSDDQIPEPKGGYGDALIRSVSEGNDWIIPIVPSAERTDTDRAGKSCFVWDCCMNPKVIAEALISPPIKVLLIETCIELIEDRSSVELSREYVLPKLLVKGQLQKTLLHSSQLYEPDGPEGVSLVGGVDSLIKEVLKEKKERNEDVTTRNKDSDRPILIEEISSENAHEITETEPSSSLSYKILNLPNSDRSSPRCEIQVFGLDAITVQRHEPKILSNGKIAFGDLIAPIPKSANSFQFEAFFTKDTNILHIFI